MNVNFEKKSLVCIKGVFFFEKCNVCIKSGDNTTHHPHHNLDWDIPPGVFAILMAEGEA